jgi:predicted nucleic acid-binding protein
VKPIAEDEWQERFESLLSRGRDVARLKRPMTEGEEDVKDVLTLLAPFLPSVDIDVPIRDPADAPVVAAALAGDAEIIVTGDKDLLEDLDLRRWLAIRRIEVASPFEFLQRLQLA